MRDAEGPATLDTNVAIYAIADDPKGLLAAALLQSCAFLSVQFLNEFANVATRKLQRKWPTVFADLERLRSAGPLILPIDDAAHVAALRIAARYQVSFYDALMLAVALSGGARIFYSEDMQHDMIIDGTLRIIDPFRPDAQ